MQHKSFPFEVKEVAADGHTFEGHASVFQTIDSGGDIVCPGAFKRCLPEFLRRGKVIWQHQWAEPIGRPLKAEEDGKGLLVAGRLSDTARGRDALTLMRDGVVSELSIGYEPKEVQQLRRERDVRDYWDGSGYEPTRRDVMRCHGGARLLKEVHLWEVSPVTFAMNEDAAITGMKGASGSTSLPLAPRSREWDASAAEGRVRSWAGAEEGPNAKYGRAFFWHGEGDQFGDYKLPYADVLGGELHAVPRAIFAVTARLNETQIPASDKAGIKRRVARYYARMREEFDDDSLTVPWEADGEEDEKGGPPAGLSLDDHTARVLVAVRELKQRYVDLSALRAQDGRRLSEARLAALGAVKEELEAVLAGGGSVAEDELREARLRYMRLQAELILGQIRGDS